MVAKRKNKHFSLLGFLSSKTPRGFKTVTYCLALYLHGFAEMLSQPFRKVSKVTVHGQRPLQDKIAICTGGTSGIGWNISQQLCELGATVIMGGLQPVTNSIDDRTKGFIQSRQLIHLNLNLSSYKSIQMFSEQISHNYKRIDYLINNAGVMLTPYNETSEGFEGHMVINLLGHVYLTKLLRPLLMNHRHSLVINVASSVHELGSPDDLFDSLQRQEKASYSPHYCYAQSKLAIVLYSKYLAAYSGMNVLSVHPGIVASSLYKNVVPLLRWIQENIFRHLFFRTTDEGATVIVNALLSFSPKLNGFYCVDNDFRKVEADENFVSQFGIFVDGIIKS